MSAGYLIAALILAAIVIGCAIASVLMDDGSDSFDDFDCHP